MPALALVAGEALGPRDALRHRDAPAPSTSPAGCPLCSYTIVRRCLPLRFRFSSTLALSRFRWKNPECDQI